RKRFASLEAVFAGVGVDEAAHGAVFAGDFRLDAAPGAAVFDDDDSAIDRNAQPGQQLVVFRDAIVNEDQRCGDVAVDGIRVVSGKLFVLLIGRRILRYGRLLQLGGELGAAFDQLNGALFWRR